MVVKMILKLKILMHYIQQDDHPRKDSTHQKKQNFISDAAGKNLKAVVIT